MTARRPMSTGLMLTCVIVLLASATTPGLSSDYQTLLDAA